MKQRGFFVTCNDFQGNDPESVEATVSAGKAVKNVFDATIKATREQLAKERPLTAEDEQKLRNMTVTVKVMKVEI
jgi:hypothetical protein